MVLPLAASSGGGDYLAMVLTCSGMTGGRARRGADVGRPSACRPVEALLASMGTP